MVSEASDRAPAGLETPSGKGAGDENFPVGSFLLPAALRPHVAAFYAFVRAADDVADNPALSPDDKIRRLARFAEALTGSAEQAAVLPKAVTLRASLAATGVSAQHALDLLAAFTQDATKLRYRDWPDLLGYCALSARPVGRYLLDLHGEPSALYALSDPLCDALQVLNHLQDCQSDYHALDRVYLPLDRFAAAGIGIEELDRPRAGPALRRVFDDTLAGVDRLLEAAGDLPQALTNRRLAAESAVILELARRLAGELRRRDPLAERVELGRAAFLRAALSGLARMPWLRRRRPLALTPGARIGSEGTTVRTEPLDAAPAAELAAQDLDAARAHVRTVVAGSGSSFYWSMRLLPRAKRDAMYAIYAFCREVDDIADGDGLPAVKLAELAGWRSEIAALFAGRPSRPTTRALALPVSRFDLPRTEFDAMIDGMEMDAGERMRAPSLADLERYCRCVAGAVGLLSVRVFGTRGPCIEQGALALGEALQLTNILRDLTEDAGRGRLYLPRELLQRHGIAGSEPDLVLAHQALPEVCATLAEQARQRFAGAERLLAAGDRRQLRPALVMMQVYRRTLERLIARGWQRLDQPVRVARPERLWLALRYGLL